MNAPILSSLKINLPTRAGALETFVLSEPRAYPEKASAAFNRVAFSATHVVADARAANDPWIDCSLDWDRTIAYREYLWGLGLGVAEAMDTAQRGMGLDWPTSLELITRAVNASKAWSAREGRPALIAAGCGTDQLDLSQVRVGQAHSIDEVIRAYEEQMAAIEKAGGRLIIMASRALARSARSPADYERVYDRVLAQAREPVIIHWLGEMFDPMLAGYWGSADHFAAMKIALGVINAHAAKVDGVKISLLDKEKEIVMRRQLAKGVRMYTGDDFNYALLIAGDEKGYSDALLGIFDAIAPAASAALAALSAGDGATFEAILAPTVPLSRHIFQAPTRFYKTGVVFMAYLNGHQEHFVMVGGQQSARSIVHLAQLFRLADRAGLLRDPDLARRRMVRVLALHGIA
ncbi:MAG TPA: dihydrodipicolinate synthase family protein [Hyphomicrobiaceae bacterium]|nr:dihydrodipicolinate synthase family protein [Hyphomicrobiaceae bacterium]